MTEAGDRDRQTRGGKQDRGRFCVLLYRSVSWTEVARQSTDLRLAVLVGVPEAVLLHVSLTSFPCLGELPCPVRHCRQRHRQGTVSVPCSLGWCPGRRTIHAVYLRFIPRPCGLYTARTVLMVPVHDLYLCFIPQEPAPRFSRGFGSANPSSAAAESVLMNG
jgi:hypothetical protein